MLSWTADLQRGVDASDREGGGVAAVHDGNASPEEYQKVCQLMPSVPVSIVRPHVLRDVAKVLPEPAGVGQR